MLIEIDCRERELYQQCLAYLQQNSGIENIDLKSSNLPIGDVIIYNDANTEMLVEKIIIERKSVNDLAASIRDARYREQSYRLGECSLHNHNIFYLIEGDFSRLGRRYNKKTLLSAITSISYIKGFSLYRTFSIAESAEWIVQMANKIHRTKETPYYCVERTEEEATKIKNRELSEVAAYSSVMKRVKKHNITRNNIGEIMLMQIPDVSPASAKAVMEKYKSIQMLLQMLKNCPLALDEIVITSGTKTRKLNKTCKANIYNYLFPDAEAVITIDTK